MPAQDSLVDQIRDVLAHLYDYPYLRTHPLADALQPGKAFSARERMRFLRSTILETIEEMNPGSNVPSRSAYARSYDVLKLHYVEGLMIDEVARELSISKRQVYRNLNQAVKELTTLLLDRHPRIMGAGLDQALSLSRAELVLQEAGRVIGKVEEVALQPLLQGAIDAVSRLAQKHSVQIESSLASGLDSECTNRQIARQALVNLLSHAVQTARPDTTLLLLAQPGGSGARFQIEFTPEKHVGTSDPFPAVARQLIGRLGGQCWSRPGASGRVALTFTLRGRNRAVVLVIDDNEGLAEVFRRYLADSPYQLVEARDGREGLRLVQESAPDIIVLDVMMPQQDGWEVLQRLQIKESTSHIPVIVCSVFDDPELAYSLGATEFLAKPVSRSRLLAALSRC